jgi:ABC-type antimicrobial peptide transport system permease subunit
LGVRIALGAEPRSVAMMMTNQGLMLTAFGVGGGLLMFALVARFLRTFLFGVAASDPLTLGGASLTLVAIAALASWIPARRAAAVDPADALRAE